MPAKGSAAWYRDRRDAIAPIPQAKLIDDAILRMERDELLRLLRAVASELDDDTQPPGHWHTVPGVWDADNGPLAGRPCEWCKTWNRVREVLAKYPTEERQ